MRFMARTACRVRCTLVRGMTASGGSVAKARQLEASRPTCSRSSLTQVMSCPGWFIRGPQIWVRSTQVIAPGLVLTSCSNPGPSRQAVLWCQIVMPCITVGLSAGVSPAFRTMSLSRFIVPGSASRLIPAASFTSRARTALFRETSISASRRAQLRILGSRSSQSPLGLFFVRDTSCVIRSVMRFTRARCIASWAWPGRCALGISMDSGTARVSSASSMVPSSSLWAPQSFSPSLLMTWTLCSSSRILIPLMMPVIPSWGSLRFQACTSFRAWSHAFSCLRIGLVVGVLVISLTGFCLWAMPGRIPLRGLRRAVSVRRGGRVSSPGVRPGRLLPSP